jgi:hypothetical protein
MKSPSEMMGFFVKCAPENPALWAGMKGVSAEGIKINFREMLKRVQTL